MVRWWIGKLYLLSNLINGERLRLLSTNLFFSKFWQADAISGVLFTKVLKSKPNQTQGLSSFWSIGLRVKARKTSSLPEHSTHLSWSLLQSSVENSALILLTLHPRWTQFMFHLSQRAPLSSLVLSYCASLILSLTRLHLPNSSSFLFVSLVSLSQSHLL